MDDKELNKFIQDADKRLKAFFPEEQLEWRVQQAGISNGKPWALVFCYVQARAIEDRLDEVFGFCGWQNEIRVEGENIVARLGVKVGDNWVWKENGASQTEIEAFKGGISGAIKRVASSGFGIGRYLYQLDATFAECSMEKKQGWNTAKTKDKQTFYWKTPSIPAKFLPKASEEKQEYFSEHQQALVKEKYSINAVANALARMNIKDLSYVPLNYKTEFFRYCKEEMEKEKEQK